MVTAVTNQTSIVIHDYCILTIREMFGKWHTVHQNNRRREKKLKRGLKLREKEEDTTEQLTETLHSRSHCEQENKVVTLHEHGKYDLGAKICISIVKSLYRLISPRDILSSSHCLPLLPKTCVAIGTCPGKWGEKKTPRRLTSSYLHTKVT